MYSLQLLKLNAPIVKQTVAEAPDPLSFEDRLGRLMHVTGSRDTQLVYDYMDGFVVLTKIEGPAPEADLGPDDEPYVVIITNLDTHEVQGVYGPYADRMVAVRTGETLQEGFEDDEPGVEFGYEAHPVVNVGGRG